MGLLDVAVAVHLQEDVLHPRRRAAAEGRLDERADDVPDLRPALRGRLPHRSRVLGAEDRPRGVVVDLDVAGSPPEEELEAVDQEDPHHGAQARATRTRRRRSASTTSRWSASARPSRRRPTDSPGPRLGVASERSRTRSIHPSHPRGVILPDRTGAGSPHIERDRNIVVPIGTDRRDCVAVRAADRTPTPTGQAWRDASQLFQKTCTPLSDAYEPAGSRRPGSMALRLPRSAKGC